MNDPSRLMPLIEARCEEHGDVKSYFLTGAYRPDGTIGYSAPVGLMRSGAKCPRCISEFFADARRVEEVQHIVFAVE